TNLALRYWPTAQYTLFEPLIECQKYLENLQNQYVNVNYRLIAVGEITKTEVDLGVNKEYLYDSSLMRNGSEIREVPQWSIDDLIQERKVLQPDFMKIDVQGAQLLVLEGAKQTIENCSLILIEVPFYRFSQASGVFNIFHEYIAWMAEHQFIPYEIVDVLRRPLDGAMGQCDILFCKVGHELMSDRRWNPGINQPSMVDSSKTKYGKQNTQQESQTYIEKGNQLWQKGKLGEAMLAYRQAVELNQNFYLPYQKIGEILAKQGKYDEAIMAFRQAIKLSPNSVWSYHHLGSVLFQKGELEEATTAYRKAIELDPQVAWYHNGLGQVWLQKKNLSAAINEFEEAIRLKPNIDIFHRNLGIALARQGNLERATNAYRTAISINPQLEKELRKTSPTSEDFQVLQYILRRLSNNN
ncbi:MAG: FkbM family methyltransferase, partial [Okeania sp. SIO3B3]|nr:FkbM family methyltransferase [Okeania sp. SIO3B3]